MGLGVQFRGPLSEEELFGAYSNSDGNLPPPPRVAATFRAEIFGLRTEQCACGGTLSVAIDTAQYVTAAVVEHQQDPRHRAWWAWMEASL